jgi:hypothetical protein
MRVFCFDRNWYLLREKVPDAAPLNQLKFDLIKKYSNFAQIAYVSMNFKS